MKKLLGYLFYIVYFVLVIVFISLMVQTLIRMNKPTPETIKKYIELFSVETNSYVGYPFVFVFSNDNILGTCRMIGSAPFYVSINSKSWDSMSDEERLLLVFHEAGHCTYSLKHDDSKFEDGCAKSLMNSYLPEYYCINKHGLNYYLNEFKGRLK